MRSPFEGKGDTENRSLNKGLFERRFGWSRCAIASAAEESRSSVPAALGVTAGLIFAVVCGWIVSQAEIAVASTAIMTRLPPRMHDPPDAALLSDHN